MKISLLATTIVASLVALSVVSQLGAQPGGPTASAARSSGNGVALVDLGKIFKESIRFKDESDALGRDIKAAEDVLNKDRVAIQKMIEKLKSLKSNHPDFRHLEEDITEKQAGFQVRAQNQKRDFQEREANLYLQTLQKINDTIKVFADRNGISLVMKFQSEPMDAADRESIMRELNKPVAYYNKGIDITSYIIEDLNRGAVKPQVGNRPPALPNR